MAKSSLKAQIIKFTFVGAVAALADLSFYYLFLQILPEFIWSSLNNETLAKGLSFIIGTTVTYYLNKFWTWKKKGRSTERVLKFLGLYAVTLLINVGVNSMLLYLFHYYQDFYNVPNKYLIAFVGAAGASACVNFIGQKFWVFKHSKNTEEEPEFNADPKIEKNL